MRLSFDFSSLDMMGQSKERECRPRVVGCVSQFPRKRIVNPGLTNFTAAAGLFYSYLKSIDAMIIMSHRL